MTVFGNKVETIRSCSRLEFNLSRTSNEIYDPACTVAISGFQLRKKKTVGQRGISRFSGLFTRTNHFVWFTERALRQSTFELHVYPITGPTAFKKKVRH